MTDTAQRRGMIRPITDLPLNENPSGGVVEVEKDGLFYQVVSDLIGGSDPALAPDADPTAETDEFTESALNAKWSWHNQSTSTALMWKSRAILNLASSGGSAAWRGITQPIPLAIQNGWAARTYLDNYSSPADCSGGLWARRSANGRFLTWVDITRVAVPGALLADMWAATDWADLTTPNANRFGPQNQENARRAFLQMRCDGTSLYWDYSPDNGQMISVGSVALATYLGGVPDQFGLGGNAPALGKFGFDWFRVYYNSNLNQGP